MAVRVVNEVSLDTTENPIPGMYIINIPVHCDHRGWFKENWQREKMCRLGLPDRKWVQNNISYNDSKGVTRGVHAEPWNKLVSVATGTIFGVWVDLRVGPSFGKVFTCVLDPSKAVYVPRGVGNAYQTLEDGTTYTYLVDCHWSAELKKTYTFVNLGDPALGIEWPIPLSKAIISADDRKHPQLVDVIPMTPRRTLVVADDTELERAIRDAADERGVLEWFDFVCAGEFDITDSRSIEAYDLSPYGTIINCRSCEDAGKANGDETDGHNWAVNAAGPARLSRLCSALGITLMHISADYLNSVDNMHCGDESPISLGVRGCSKIVGDLAVMCCPSHYILYGGQAGASGRNLAEARAMPSDCCSNAGGPFDAIAANNAQLGQALPARELVDAIFWLLGYRRGDFEPSSPAVPGVYSYTHTGRIALCKDIAREVQASPMVMAQH